MQRVLVGWLLLLGVTLPAAAQITAKISPATWTVELSTPKAATWTVVPKTAMSPAAGERTTMAAPAGVYRVEAELPDGTGWFAKIVLGGGSPPVPPIPVPPTPDPAPQAISAAIVESAELRSSLTSAQVGAIIDAAASTYQGRRYWRVYDREAVDQMGKPAPGLEFFGKYATADTASVVIAVTGKNQPLYTGTLPANSAELLALLEQYGGPSPKGLAAVPALDLAKLPVDALPPAKASMGLLPRDRTRQKFEGKPFASAFRTIPRSEWPARAAVLPVGILQRHVRKIKDQDGLGSCCSNATAMTVEVSRDVAGLPFVELSPSSIYCNLTYPRDGGSTLEENLQWVSTVGIAPVTLVPANEWSNPAKWAAGWKIEAAKYRLTDWYDLDGSFDNVVSAVLYGYPVNIGINWPSGGGHSICVVGVVQSGATWQLLIANSWGDGWGTKGFGLLTEAQCKALPNYGAWAAVTPIYPSDQMSVSAPKGARGPKGPADESLPTLSL